eukprot:9073022-Pyramimonas_sp.AAC.1
MHAHVAACPERQREGYGGSFHDFNQHHQRRRARLVQERLAQCENAEVREKAKRKLRPDLENGQYTVTID